MALNSIKKYLGKLQALEEAMKKYPYRAGVIAVNFSKERFRQQNWIDNHTEPWQKKKLNSGGTTLIKSGKTKRATRITQHNKKRVIIGNDQPGAQANNEGLKIPVTEKMRSFFMAKHIDLKEKGKTKEATYYLNLSLTKKKFFKLPKRKFMGASQYQNKLINRQMTADISKALKK